MAVSTASVRCGCYIWCWSVHRTKGYSCASNFILRILENQKQVAKHTKILTNYTNLADKVCGTEQQCFLNSKMFVNKALSIYFVGSVQHKCLVFRKILYFFQYILFVLRAFCWFLLPISCIIPLFAPQAIIVRLISWFSSIFLPYSLLSLSYEPSFLFFLFILLGLHVRLQFDDISDDEFLTLSLAKQNKQESVKGVSLSNFMAIIRGFVSLDGSHAYLKC